MTSERERRRRGQSPRTSANRAEIHVPASTLREYRRFSLYNSPYPAHDAGCAIDLYPATNEGISPVAGEVRETRVVRAPSKPYAADEEYLILIDVNSTRSGIGVSGVSRGGTDTEVEESTGEFVARILHVRPRVEPGDTVDVGDSLGEMIRSGFFAPWVANHVHVGVRRAEQHLHRAGGSLPVIPDVDIDPIPWDGVGTVVEMGATYALLDAPVHPTAGGGFAGLSGTVEPLENSASRGEHSADGGNPVVLDGGLAHYAGGGVLGGNERSESRTQGRVSFLGHPVADRSGRNATWRDIDVLANGDRITGLSLFVGRGSSVGAKLVCPEREFAVGDRVAVSIRDSDDPIRLG